MRYLTASLLFILVFFANKANAQLQFDFYHEWDFESSFDSWQISNDTGLEIVPAPTFHEYSGMKMTSTEEDSETELFNESFPYVHPGFQIVYHVWLDDSALSNINELVLYIDKSDNSHQTKTYSSEYLTPNSWNRLSIINNVEETSSISVSGFGLQMRENNETDTTSIFVDFIQVFSPYHETFDFEGYQISSPWEIINGNGSFSIIDTIRFSGTKVAQISTDSDSIQFANTTPSQYLPGQVISFRFWLPEDTTFIQHTSIFVEYDTLGADSNSILYNTYQPKDLSPGTWNNLKLTIPEYDSLKTIGLEIVGKESTGSPDFFVDFITTDSTRLPLSIAKAPDQVSIDSLSRNYVSFSWENNDNGHRFSDLYRIWKKEPGSFMQVIDTVLALTDGFHSFTDSLLDAGRMYQYKISAVDTNGRESSHFNIIEIETLPPPDPITWDFESGSNGWFNYTLGDSVGIADTISFSGIQSAVLTVPDDQDFGFIGTTVNKFEVGQGFKFHFYLPADTSNIRSISISTYANEKVLFEEHFVSEFEPGAWNSVIYYPEVKDTPFDLAFNLFSKSTGTPTVFVDFISTDFNLTPLPQITAPEDLTAHILDEDRVIVSWKESRSIGPVSYNVYRTVTDFTGKTEDESKTELIANTEDYYYFDKEFSEDEDYSYYVRAVNEDSIETDRSNIFRADEARFDSYATFEFEYEHLEDWKAINGKAVVVDTLTYSGIYSASFTTEGRESYFEFSDEDTTKKPTDDIRQEILVGQTVYYQLMIENADKPNIESIELYAIDGKSRKISHQIDLYNYTPDLWRRYSLTLPSGMPGIRSIGVKVTTKDDSSKATVHIDQISTWVRAWPLPHLTIPQNLHVAVTDTNYYLTWKRSTGDAELDEYIVMIKEVDYPWEPEVLVHTRNVWYRGVVEEKAVYELSVVAVTRGGHQTLPATIEASFLPTDSETEPEIPINFKLDQNYPNPFNPGTVIRYQIPVNSLVSLKVFDLLGRKVAVLVNGRKSPGTHEVNFDASALASGIYIYRLEAGSFIQTQRMTLIK